MKTVEVVPAEGIDHACMGYDMRPMMRGGRTFRPCMAPALAAVIVEEDGARKLVGFACRPHAHDMKTKGVE